MTQIKRTKTNFDIPEAHKQEVRRRIAKMEQYPESRLTWEEIESMLSVKICQLSDCQLKRVDQAHLEWLNGELISSEDLYKEFKSGLMQNKIDQNENH